MPRLLDRTGALTRERRRQAGRLQEDVHPDGLRLGLSWAPSLSARSFAVLVGSEGTGVRSNTTPLPSRTLDGTARDPAARC